MSSVRIRELTDHEDDENQLSTSKPAGVFEQSNIIARIFMRGLNIHFI